MSTTTYQRQMERCQSASELLCSLAERIRFIERSCAKSKMLGWHGHLCLSDAERAAIAESRDIKELRASLEAARDRYHAEMDALYRARLETPLSQETAT